MIIYGNPVILPIQLICSKADIYWVGILLSVSLIEFRTHTHTVCVYIYIYIYIYISINQYIYIYIYIQ